MDLDTALDNYVYVQQSGCWWASAPSPLTGFAIVCPCSHYDTATIAYKCSQFNSRYNCVQMFAIRDEMTDTGGDCACQAINGSPEKEKCHWCLKQYDAVYFLHRIETDCRKKLQSIQWTLFMQLQTKKYNPKFKIQDKKFGWIFVAFISFDSEKMFDHTDNSLSAFITTSASMPLSSHPPSSLLSFLQCVECVQCVEMYNCTDKK